MSEFDTVYHEYQRVLAQLSNAGDIRTKNELFQQLTDLLSRMEELIVSQTPGKILSGRHDMGS
ncbi:hypothetical protein [Geomesophilobacter sediminis]|uniref:Uncharacterized protein n=1 Tax=Geomesophilobacter sediminis TaxID=2798584 RepID=A0A8J7LZD0_9BACT|nr:hypothetical protein [Geomesophilobacter sediminis]MBJ6726211.1 hypothetical protein [Geomesophilobacter sediminis]